MDIKIEEIGEVVVLHMKGSLDASTVAKFKKGAWDLFEKGKLKFILDASELSFVDSMGLGAIISLLRRVREKKGDIKAVNLNRDLEEIFDITRLNKLFEVYKNVNEALSKF